MRDSFRVGRVVWWAPWGLTRPWRPDVMRGGDPVLGPSILAQLPGLGALIVFYGRRPQPDQTAD